MKYLFLSLVFFVNLALGFDSIEILNPHITVHKSGYFKTDKNLTPDQAYQLFQKGNLSALPKTAQSFGFDTAEYWFVFDVTTSEQDFHFLIDNRDALSEYCNLFVFQNGKLLRNENSGYMTPLQKRPIAMFPIRFTLEKTPIKTTYLLKIVSQYPLYASFAFGTHNEVDKTWDIRHIIFIFSCGVFFSMLLYNLFLYFVIKDKAYIFYCVYIFGFFMITMVAQGYFVLLLPTITPFSTLLLGLFLQIEFIGLVFFTSYFLRLKETFPSLDRRIRYLLYANIVASFTVPIAHGVQIISMILMNILYIVLLYAGIRSYLSGFKPALYYLIATGIALLSIFAYSFMNQGLFLSFNIWSFNLMTFGVIWDMIFLSFALAYRIKLLQEENTRNERFAIMKSRQKVIGELTGNIAHQWRQPLNTLGAILSTAEAKLKYDTISHEELIETITSSNSILKNLSNTVETMQNFFMNQNNIVEKFDLNQQLLTIINFLQDNMKNQHITIEFGSTKKLILSTDRNLLSQVIMNILLNAKNILNERNRDDKKSIIITTAIQNENVLLTIEDNGKGISTKPIEKIFEPFVSSNKTGSGLGLYMSKNIIEKLGGTINASNTLIGAKFTIILPIRNKEV